MQLPFSKAKKITLHTLAKPDGTAVDPRANNFEQDNVVITSKEVPVTAWKDGFAINASTGGGPGGLPPGAIYLYVFEGTTR
jgi:hypothetical protein